MRVSSFLESPRVSRLFPILRLGLPLAFFLVLMNAVPFIRSASFQMPELGLLSFGMMLSMFSGGLDLSLVAIANLSGIGAALLFQLGATALLPPWLSIPLVWGICLAGSLLLGGINGAVIVRTGASPIMVTIGTMTLYNGLALALTGGSTLSPFPEAYQILGYGSLGGISIPLLLFILTGVSLFIFLERTVFGRILLLSGANPRAVAFGGLDVRGIRMKVSLLSGIVAGLAGLVMTARFNSARAGYGESYLLMSILIVVLGGVRPEGGREGSSTSSWRYWFSRSFQVF